MDHQNLSFSGLTAALKAAGEPTRLRILALLAEAELTVSDRPGRPIPRGILGVLPSRRTRRHG